MIITVRLTCKIETVQFCIIVFKNIFKRVVANRLLVFFTQKCIIAIKNIFKRVIADRLLVFFTQKCNFTTNKCENKLSCFWYWNLNPLYESYL